MTLVSRIAAVHGAFWASDPWYRFWWYVWPTSLAILVCGWICVDGPRQNTPPASLAKPFPASLPSGVLSGPGGSSWLGSAQDQIARCLSNPDSIASMQACNNLIALGQVRGPQLAQAYTRRGFLRRETNPSLALVDYDSALRIQTSAEALTGRAWISMNRREYDVALTDLGKAIDMSPAPTSAALARYYRGYALLRLGNYPQAQMDLDEAIRLQPDIADYYLARGEAQQGLKALDAALRDADEFSRRAPKDIRGLVLRGAVLEAMGKPQEALAAFESAVALSPNDDYAVSERDRLRAQKGPQGKGDPAK
jgi:tetratricopeptide (TPR) repeat protein